MYIYVVVQLPSHVWLFATPRTATHQASLALTISRSLPKFMSIASVMPSSNLILWRSLLLLPSILLSIRDFTNEFASGDQNTGALASASVLPVSIQGWFPLRLTGLISLLSKGLSGVFSSTPVMRLSSGLPLAPFHCSDSSVGKESTCNTGHPGLIPEWGRFTREGIGYPRQYSWVFLVAQLVNNPPATRETWVWSLGREDTLENGKATYSSILAWRIS